MGGGGSKCGAMNPKNELKEFGDAFTSHDIT